EALKGSWTASAATNSGRRAGGSRRDEAPLRTGGPWQEIPTARSLPSLRARGDTSTAATLQVRPSIAARVLPLPQPSSRTRAPSGRGGSLGGDPRQIFPLSR